MKALNLRLSLIAGGVNVPSRVDPVQFACLGCGTVVSTRAMRVPEYCSRSCKSIPTEYNLERFGECGYVACDRPRYESSEYCNPHYQQVSKGHSLRPVGEPRNTVESRFFAKVTQTVDCWHWAGSCYPNGYGQFWALNEQYAHRVSYRLFNGDIPEGLQVDHKCHTHGCVNPEHLQVVTASENGQNRKGPNPKTKSGVRGVSWNSATGKWIVTIRVNGHHRNFGSFDGLEEAAAAARNARIEFYTNSLKDFE